MTPSFWHLSFHFSLIAVTLSPRLPLEWMIFRDQVDVVFLRVVYHLFQPYDIRMLKCGENLQLFQEAIINLFPLQVLLFHWLQCILNIHVGFVAQVHGCKSAFAEGLLDHVRVNHLFTSKVFRSHDPTQLRCERHLLNPTMRFLILTAQLVS